MSNNIHKNSACDYAESLISYLYDEIGATEKAALEGHLKNCVPCRDDLAAVGFARSAIHEWRVEEFDTLATPHFEIFPLVGKIETSAAAPKSGSWFDGWRSIFAFKPTLALSASAILIAVFAAAFLLFNFKRNDQIAGGITNRQLINAAVSPTVERKVELPKEATVDKAAAVLKAKTSTSVDREMPVTPKTPAVKISSAALKNVSDQVYAPNRIVQKPRRDVQVPPNAPKVRVPRLTEAEEEDDDSVRLTDLFDEIETR